GRDTTSATGPRAPNTAHQPPTADSTDEGPGTHHHSHPTTDASQTDPDPHQAGEALRDISEVASVEINTTACVHLMSAAAVKLGLAEDEETGQHQDLAEARKLINALAGLVTAAAPEIGNEHAR